MLSSEKYKSWVPQEHSVRSDTDNDRPDRISHSETKLNTHDKGDAVKKQTSSEKVTYKETDASDVPLILDTSRNVSYQQDAKTNQEGEDFSSSESVLSFFSSIGEVLMFPEVEKLRGKVIIQPMEFIKDCR